jgi:hypothetical protein
LVAVAQRTDCDEVLFATADPSKPLALDHLTWSGRSEEAHARFEAAWELLPEPRIDQPPCTC